MFRRIFPVVVVLTLFATPALASHCPLDMKKIDEALQSTELSAAALAKVKGLRAKGEAMHKTGKHGKSVEALHEALEILGIAH